jgi:hypothetical protein
MSPADASIARTLDATGNPTLLRSGCKVDTSPPDGLLLLNRLGILVYESQLALNQCFAKEAPPITVRAFTGVNREQRHSVRRVNALINKGFHHPGA